MKAKHSQTSRADAEESAPDLSGETFGDFRLVRRLGQAAWAGTWPSRLSLSRKVAIKVLREDIARTPSRASASRRESRTIAS